MDRATFERQKAFAGEKKPSMQRRCVDHDYTERRMYMVTMVTEERKPLFGKALTGGQEPCVAKIKETSAVLGQRLKE